MKMRVRLFYIYFRKGGGEKNNYVVLLMIIYLVKYTMNNYVAI